MSWFEIYLWTRLDYINGTLITLAVSSTFGAVVMHLMYWTGDWNSDKSDEKKVLDFLITKKKPFLVVSILSILLAIFTPTKHEAAAIYVIPKVANSKIVKQIPDDLNEVYKLGIQELKESIIGERPQPEAKEKNK